MKLVCPLCSVLLFFGCLISSPVFAASQRAAVIYSSWNKGKFSFKHEWDEILRAKDIPFDGYENTQLKKLAGKLDDYSIVIGSSVCNFENTQDFGEVKEPFLTFLRRGGIVLITDASYSSVLDQGICRWSPDFALGFEISSSHKRPSKETRKLSLGKDSVLAQVPSPLLKDAQAAGHWAHLVPLSTKWRQALLDSDGNPVLVWQPVGNGLLAVTSHFSFKRLSNRPLASKLVENVGTLAGGMRFGLEIVKLDWGTMDPGENQARLDLRNAGEGMRNVEIEFCQNASVVDSHLQRIKRAIPAGETASFVWNYMLVARGKRTLNLTVREAGREKALFTLEKRRMIPDLIEVFSWKRHVYRNAKQVGIEVDLLPDQPFKPDGCSLVADLEVAGIRSMTVKAPPVSGSLAIPLIGVPSGEGTIRVRLLRGETELGRKELPCAIAPTPYVELLPDRSCRVAGKPFFPMGMYIVSWGHKGTEPILQNMREIAAAGFNMVHVGARNDEEFTRILDEAKHLKLMVIPEGRPAHQPEKYRNHRSILAWNPGDEPDGKGRDPKEVARIVADYREKDMSRPTYMTLCVPQTYDQYARAADILAPDPYPIGRGKVTKVSECLERLQAVVGQGKPIWAIPQAFGGYGGWRVPTPAEERNMTYQCLIQGSRGLVYYTYFDGNFKMEEHPELWGMMKQLAKEVGQLSPLFLAGTSETVRRVGAEKEILLLLKSLGNRSYLLACNLSEKETKIKLPLPDLYRGTLREVFKGSEVKVVDKAVELSFPPLGVWVYVVSRK